MVYKNIVNSFFKDLFIRMILVYDYKLMILRVVYFYNLDFMFV